MIIDIDFQNENVSKLFWVGDDVISITANDKLVNYLSDLLLQWRLHS